MPEDVPTIEIRNFTPSDSSHDTPSPSGPEPPARKTVRFAIWSHMRTFERPEWEPIGQAYEGAYEEATYNKSNKPGGRALLRKVWTFDRLYDYRITNVAESFRSIEMVLLDAVLHYSHE